MYPNLKLYLWRAGIRQNKLAQMVQIDETLLSKVLNGFRQPTSDLRARIAHALNAEESWLFATNEEDTAAPDSSSAIEARTRCAE